MAPIGMMIERARGTTRLPRLLIALTAIVLAAGAQGAPGNFDVTNLGIGNNFANFASTPNVVAVSGDFDGDGFADSYAVRNNQIWVSWNNGNTASPGFTGQTHLYNVPHVGTHATTFADINGDGYADYVVVKDDRTEVMYSR